MAPLTPRVVHLIGADVGGAEQQLVGLLEEDTSGAVRHEVLLVRDGPLRPAFCAVAPTVVLGKSSALDLRFLRQLVSRLRASHADVLHTWTSTPNLWGPPAARLARVPRVVMAEVGLEDWKGRALRTADRVNYRLAGRVVGCAEAVSAAAVERGAPAARTTTVPLAVRIPPSHVPRPQTSTVLLLGRYDARKGHAVLLDAVPTIRKDVPDVRVLMAGPAVQPDELSVRSAVTDRVTAEGLQGCVQVMDRMPVDEAMSQADVVVVPSTSEGLPNVVLEAFAHERPVVATDVGGISEVVQDGATGWLVPPRDSDALGAAVVSALLQPDEAARRAHAGRQLAESRSFAHVVEAWHAVYASVLR